MTTQSFKSDHKDYETDKPAPPGPVVAGERAGSSSSSDGPPQWAAPNGAALSLCSTCGKPLPRQRTKRRRYCDARCRKAGQRAREKRDKVRRSERRPLPRSEWKFIDPDNWRPPSLYAAALALRRGVPVKALDLSHDELAIAICLSSKFPLHVQLEAAGRLARHFGWARDGSLGTKREADDALRHAVLDAVRLAREPLTVFPSVTGRGRPRSVEPWEPWRRYAWAIYLNWFLPYVIRKYYVRTREEDATNVSLSSVVSKDEDGNDLTLEDTLGVEDQRFGEGSSTEYPPSSEHRAYPKPHVVRGRYWAKTDQALRGGYERYRGARGWYGGVSSDFAEAMKLRFHGRAPGHDDQDSRLSNPDLPLYVLKELRQEIASLRAGPGGGQYATDDAVRHVYDDEYEAARRGDVEEVEEEDVEEEVEDQPHLNNKTFAAQWRAKRQKEQDVTQAQQIEAVQDRIDGLEQKFAAALGEIGETAQRIAARFPNDERVQEAVDKLIEDTLDQ